MTEKSPTRRTLLASVGGAGLIGLAGCADDGGGNGSDGGSPSGSGSGSGDDGNGAGGGSSDSSGAQVQGLESVTLNGKNLTVRRVEDSNVAGIRLYDPNDKAVVMGDEQVVSGVTGGDFNNQREIELRLREGIGAAEWPAGEWTIETYAQGGSTIDSGSITITREFDVTDARYQSPGGDAKGDDRLLFEIESTGDLPVRIQSIAVLETTNAERFQSPTPTAEGRDIRGPPGLNPRLVWTGEPKEVYIGGEFTFMSDGNLADSPCAGMRLERTYELTAKTGESASADVTLEFGEGVQKDALTDQYWCTNGEVVAFSGDSAG